MPDPKFFVDSMLGKLARWLIVLGYDARFAGAAETPAPELLRQAKDEKRIFVTRDAKIPAVTGVRKIVLAKADFHDQLVQVIRMLRLNPRVSGLFRRCTTCNRELAALARAEALPQVPDKVKGLDTKFFQCPSCRKIYWNGEHTERTITKLKAMGVIRG